MDRNLTDKEYLLLYEIKMLGERIDIIDITKRLNKMKIKYDMNTLKNMIRRLRMLNFLKSKNKKLIVTKKDNWDNDKLDRIKKGKPNMIHNREMGKNSRLAGKKLHKLIKSNPRKKDTKGWKSWELILNGMTYEDFRKAGGRPRDLLTDIKKGHIEVT